MKRRTTRKRFVDPQFIAKMRNISVEEAKDVLIEDLSKENQDFQVKIESLENSLERLERRTRARPLEERVEALERAVARLHVDVSPMRRIGKQ